MEVLRIKRQALLWGHIFVTLPAATALSVVLFFHSYLLIFVPGWPYCVTLGIALAYQWHTAAIGHWRVAQIKRGLSETEVDEIARKGRLLFPGASWAGLFALHTTAAALCAMYLSLWLAGVLVRWVLPLIGQPAPLHVMDFYFQHFELANVIPAFLVACLMVIKFPRLGIWAWLMPTLVIVYKLVTFVEPNASVLVSGDPWRRFSYYFVIERVAPTLKFTRTTFDVSGDPLRVLAQMQVVATFYCGIAYSLGAFAMKTRALRRAWEHCSREAQFEITTPEEGVLGATANLNGGAVEGEQ